MPTPYPADLVGCCQQPAPHLSFRRRRDGAPVACEDEQRSERSPADVASRPLIYIHGAGAQKRPKDLKEECDQLIFGKIMANSRIAYYADVRWPPAGAGPVAARPGAGAGGRKETRAAREKWVKTASKQELSARKAAFAIVAARLAPGAAGEIAAAAGPRRRAGGAAGVPADAAEAQELAEQLFKRADRIAARSAAPGNMAGIGFFDPVFRWAVGRFASDVVDYLWGGFAEQMRAPVRAAFLNGPPPEIVVCHSLGTIITYYVMSEPAFAGLNVPLLVTLGSPLGIDNVQKKLRNGAGKPNPVPKSVKAWTNFNDRFDPVALEQTLRDEFSPPTNFPKDESVNNPAANNHDLSGYLSIPLVKAAIVKAVG